MDVSKPKAPVAATGEAKPEPIRLPGAEDTEFDGERVEGASGVSTRSALAPAHNKHSRGLLIVVKSVELKRGR